MRFSPERTKILMAREQLTIAALSRKAEIPAITISKVLSGARKPTLKTLGRLAHGLSVDVTEIVELEA